MGNALPGPMLFSPIALRGLTARNRVVVSPMSQYSSADGGPTDWHLVHLGTFAIGGAGIVFCEDTAVEARGRKTHACAGIYRDEHIPAYRRINRFLKSQGAIPAIQLGHNGRKASTRPPWDGFAPLSDADASNGQPPWPAISCSALPQKEGWPKPHELSRTEIRQVIDAWRVAAQRALEAGYEICEVHGGHGYLIHQFLSPLANQRTDSYGGDRAGRMRFCLETIEAVRAVWPADWPLFFRVSAVDGAGDHWTIDDTVLLAAEAKLRGVDVVTCSSGGIGGAMTNAVVPRTPGYHVPYAERVRAGSGVKTVAVGLITQAHQAEEILQDGKADLVALARELLYNPHWPVHAARELGVSDYLGLLPKDYAWWLRRREQTVLSSQAFPVRSSSGA